MRTSKLILSPRSDMGAILVYDGGEYRSSPARGVRIAPLPLRPSVEDSPIWPLRDGCEKRPSR